MKKRAVCITDVSNTHFILPLQGKVQVQVISLIMAPFHCAWERHNSDTP